MTFIYPFFRLPENVHGQLELLPLDGEHAHGIASENQQLPELRQGGKVRFTHLGVAL